MSQLNAQQQANPTVFPNAGHSFMYVGLDGFFRTMDPAGNVVVYGPGGGGVTGAASGVFLNGANVQLGSNGGANPLLADTDIDVAAFALDVDQAGKKVLLLDPTNDNYKFGDADGISPDGVYLFINNGALFVSNQIDYSLLLSKKTDSYSMGDLGVQNNGNQLTIDDAAETIQLGNTVGAKNGLFLDLVAESGEITFGGNPALILDPGTTETYKIGDVGLANNSTVLSVVDTLARKSINITNTQSFANNAAALAGGLLAGDLYTVTGSDPLQLAIVF